MRTQTSKFIACEIWMVEIKANWLLSHCIFRWRNPWKYQLSSFANKTIQTHNPSVSGANLILAQWGENFVKIRDSQRRLRQLGAVWLRLSVRMGKKPTPISNNQRISSRSRCADASANVPMRSADQTKPDHTERDVGIKLHPRIWRHELRGILNSIITKNSLCNLSSKFF